MADPDGPVGKNCKLNNSIRATDGTIHNPDEQLTIIRVLQNLGREMYLVSMPNGTSTFVFPNEVTIE